MNAHAHSVIIPFKPGMYLFPIFQLLVCSEYLVRGSGEKTFSSSRHQLIKKKSLAYTSPCLNKCIYLHLIRCPWSGLWDTSPLFRMRIGQEPFAYCVSSFWLKHNGKIGGLWKLGFILFPLCNLLPPLVFLPLPTHSHFLANTQFSSFSNYRVSYRISSDINC